MTPRSPARRRLLAAGAAVLLARAVRGTAADAADAAVPSAAQIVEANARARGGVDAWRRIETMAWAGHTESASAPGRKLAFLLEQKRPGSTRFEVVNDGQRAIRVYDGSIGWKLRPNAKGVPELQSYTDEELRYARGAQVIEGPLMDYAAKGAVLAVEGVGEAQGRRAYVLQARLPSGGMHRVWIDAQNWLELRHDREVRGASGQPGVVSVSFRDYRAFDGLMIPLTIETGSGSAAAASRLVIEKVALNPVLDERMFAAPNVPSARKHSITVDTRTAGATGGAAAARTASP